MVFCDDTKGLISLSLVNDEQLDGFIKKLLADGYWVHQLKTGDEVIIEIKGA